jgi:hypothetical protein
MKRFVLTGFVLVGLASAFASSAGATHAWSTYHWARTANPFTIKLGDDLTTAEWKGDLATASSDWSIDSRWNNPLNTTIVPGQSTSRKCRPTAGRVEVCNNTYGNNGWLGLAQIWLSGGHITQGTSKMNDTYFNTPAYNISTEKLHVICQEVGHTFGLDHQSTTGASLNTCMDYYSNTSASDTLSTHPNDHDYEQLAIIYAHLDSVTTIGAAPTQSLAMSEDAKAEHTDRSDRINESTIVETFADGSQRVTHIVWAIQSTQH